MGIFVPRQKEVGQYTATIQCHTLSGYSYEKNTRLNMDKAYNEGDAELWVGKEVILMPYTM